MKRNISKIALLTGVSALMLASSALAQTKSTSVEEVLVTGSRTVTDGTKAPTPVTVLTLGEMLNKAPNNLADAINQLPQFVNSQSISRGGGPFANSAQDASFLNLRNLGFQRSLVLLNGQRLAPTSAEGAVDTNTLPQALVKRVDVVTGGASAVYGSDALTGVVNFILDTKFTGLKMTAQTGLSTYGDVWSKKVTLAGGSSFFGDRGHIVASFDWFDQDGNVNADRANGRLADGSIYYLGGTGTAANPFTTYAGLSRTAPTSMRITAGPLANMFFDVGGVLRPYNFGIDHGNPASQEGGDGGQQPETKTALIVPIVSTQFFSRASFDLTPHISAYAQVGYALIHNEFDSYHNIWNGGSTTSGFFAFTGNAFLTPQAQALVTANKVNSFTFSRSNNPDDTRIPAGQFDYPIAHNNQTTDVRRFATGLTGDFGSSWKWDANYSYGLSKFSSRDIEPYLPRVVAALDAVRDPTGKIVCNVTLTNPGLYPGCVPLNLFGYGAPSKEAINYTEGLDRWSVRNALSIVNANLSGQPFSVWAGPVSVAVGAEYRVQTLDQFSNGDPRVRPDTTGLRGVPVAITSWGTNNVGTTHGRVTVKEAYAEADIPLLKDLPFVDSLDLNAAFRHTDYSTAGGVNTWKLSLLYSPLPDLRLRATSSRDIRAPTLSELFSGTQIAQTTTNDPHTGKTAVITSLTGGNSALVPEIGMTTVLGFVYQPSWFKGFSLNVDRYSILIANQIATPSAAQNLADCESTNGASPNCLLITRPLPFSDRSVANFPTQLRTIAINTAKLYQEGYDIEASYRFDADRLNSNLGGTFEVRALASYLETRDTRLTLSSPKLTSAGYAVFPQLRGSVSLNYQSEKIGIFVQERATGTYNLSTSPGAFFYRDHAKAPNIFYTDVTVTYPFEVRGHQSQAFLTVNNLLNAQPPIIANTNGVNFPTNPLVYDIVGRYFTAGLRVRY